MKCIQDLEGCIPFSLFEFNWRTFFALSHNLKLNNPRIQTKKTKRIYGNVCYESNKVHSFSYRSTIVEMMALL